MTLTPGRTHIVSRLVLVGLTGALGCATLGTRGEPLLPSRCQTLLGPFRLWTHEPLRVDDPTLAQLQDLERQVESELAMRADPREAPIDVYVLKGPEAFRNLLTFYYPELPSRRAFFLAQGARRNVFSYRGQHLEEDLRHEATHALLHTSVENLPLWLDEGLAEYFEVPSARHGVNRDHLGLLTSDLRQGWRPDLERLEAVRDVRRMTASDYREAWAWAHYFLRGSPRARADLLGYLADLRGGVPAEPLSARLQETANDPASRLVAHLARVYDLPDAEPPLASANDATVYLGQNAPIEPKPHPTPRRRGVMGRVLDWLTGRP